MNTDHIHVSKSGTSYVGHDATHLFRVTMLRASIKMYAACGVIPTRGVTISRMLAMASEYTGRKYKRGEYAAAQADLTVWIETMKSAIPIIRED